MFGLSLDIDQIPTLNWRQLRERMMNRWADALNRIDRDSLKPATVTRKMISDGILIKADGVRLGELTSGYLADETSNQFSVMQLRIDLDTARFTRLAIAYSIGIYTARIPGPWIGRTFRSTVGVDGIRYGFGCADDQVCLPFTGFFPFPAPAVPARFSLSGFAVADALPGQHTVSVVIEVPTTVVPAGGEFLFEHGGEISIAALEW